METKNPVTSNKTIQLTPQQFRAMVDNMTKAVLKEERLEAAKSPDGKMRQEMARWIVRQWFSPKNAGKPWYREGVTPDNVFDVVFDPDSEFPYDQDQLLDMFQIKTDVGKKMSSTEFLRQQAAPTPDKGKRNDASNEEIGMALGNVSPQRIDQVYHGAIGKLKKMTGGLRPDKMHDVDLAGLNSDIDQVREAVAGKFAKVLSQSQGDITLFAKLLKDEGLMTPGEISDITVEEYRTWMELGRRSPEMIQAILLADIEEQDNLFQGFQKAVAKKFAQQHLKDTGKETA